MHSSSKYVDVKWKDVLVKTNPVIRFWENVHVCDSRHGSEVLGHTSDYGFYGHQSVTLIKAFYFFISISVPKFVFSYFYIKILSSRLAVEIAL
jgi:hypothetical protein